jgi:uncharacterized membrane protein
VKAGDLVSESSWVKRPIELLITVAIAVVVIGIAVGVMRWAFGMNGAPFDGTMMGWGLSALMMFMWVVFALAIAGVVIWALLMFAPAVAGRANGAPFGTPRDWSTMGAVAELKKNYARGMVSREEYLRRLEDIEGPSPAPSPPPVQK